MNGNNTENMIEWKTIWTFLFTYNDINLRKHEQHLTSNQRKLSSLAMSPENERFTLQIN